MWGVTMVHNEAETIAAVVEHMFSQGAQGIIVADNRSTDETPSILRDLQRVLPLHIVGDDLEGFFQATKMTMLADLARHAGADWIVPFDADELWFAPQGTVAEWLRNSSARVALADIYNVFPAPDDDQTEINPFVRLTHMSDRAHPLNKVAFRAHRFAKLHMGNHAVTRRGAIIDGLHIAHYPWRSFEHVARKLARGKLVMDATDQDDEVCDHWRRGGTMSMAELHGIWNQIVEGYPVPELSWAPDGSRTPRRVFEWSEWGR